MTSRTMPTIEASLPTAAFAATGARPAPNLALVAGGVEWLLAKGCTLTAKLEGEFGAARTPMGGT